MARSLTLNPFSPCVLQTFGTCRNTAELSVAIAIDCPIWANTLLHVYYWLLTVNIHSYSDLINHCESL